MMRSVSCPGCELLRRAMPHVVGRDARWQMIAAPLEHMLAQPEFAGTAREDLALVVGDPAQIPAALRGAWPNVICGGKRAELAVVFDGTPARETLLEPVPAGHVRVIVAVRELPPWAGRGPIPGLASFCHDLPEQVKAEARALIANRAVIERANPSAPALPGFTAPGGRA